MPTCHTLLCHFRKEMLYVEDAQLCTLVYILPTLGPYQVYQHGTYIPTWYIIVTACVQGRGWGVECLPSRRWTPHLTHLCHACMLLCGSHSHLLLSCLSVGEFFACYSDDCNVTCSLTPWNLSPPMDHMDHNRWLWPLLPSLMWKWLPCDVLLFPLLPLQWVSATLTPSVTDWCMLWLIHCFVHVHFGDTNTTGECVILDWSYVPHCNAVLVLSLPLLPQRVSPTQISTLQFTFVCSSHYTVCFSPHYGMGHNSEWVLCLSQLHVTICGLWFIIAMSFLPPQLVSHTLLHLPRWMMHACGECDCMLHWLCSWSLTAEEA